MKIQKGIFDFCEAMTYDKMMEYLNLLEERYPFLGVTFFGESVLGRGLPLITLGEGEKAVLYVGAESGTDSVTTAILLRFLNEFCEQYQNGGRIFQYSLPYLFSTRTVYVIPMLNPDGVSYCLEGITPENLLYDRVLSMNEGSTDLHLWRANARGVELDRNFAYGFEARKRSEAEQGILGGAKNGFSGESSESEPEVGLLCNFLRYHQDLRALVSLHTGEETVLYTAGKKTAPRSLALGGALSRLTCYPLRAYEGEQAMGGLGAWCIDECNLPAFSVACGSQEAIASDWFRAYAALRETLFTLPTMI